MSKNFSIKNNKKIVSLLMFLLAVFIINIDNVNAENITKTFNYDYTGGGQEFTAPYTGTYRLETWGAQGTNYTTTIVGGYGAYSTGNVSLSKGSKLYIYTGGQGSGLTGGYNGGGNGGSYGGQQGFGGGGATHIATTNRGLLKTYNSYRGELLIVSGGGTGAGIVAEVRYFNSASGYGSAGGIRGNDGINYYTPNNTGHNYYKGTGGTQTAGGYCTQNSNDAGSRGSFGQGGNNYHPGNDCYGGPGGGGGFFGGGGSNRSHASAGGGSSYIGNSSLLSSEGVTKHMTCYNCATDGNVATRTISNNYHSSTPTTDYAKEGNGYAKITLLSSSTMLSNLSVSKGSLEESFDKYRTEYTWIIPKGVDTLTDADVTATAVYNSSQVIIPEEVEFTQDGDKFEIEVISQEGEKQTYTLTMKRYVSNDATLSSLTSDQGILTPEFDPEKTTYSLEFMDDLDSINIDAEVNEQDATVTGTGEVVLEENETIHNITVTAEDGTIKVYKVKIYKNMYLEDIGLLGLEDLECEDDQCVISPEFDPTVEEYTIKVPYEYTDLNVTYTPSYKGLTVGIRVDGQSYVKHQIINGIKAEVVYNIYNSDNQIVRSYKLNVTKTSSLISEFPYTGAVQVFNVPRKGKYKIETWGAQGGNYTASIIGGYGAYSVGVASLNRGTNLYVYTGGQGTSLNGGYNGGGNGGSYGGQYGFGGGGATHIATTNRGLLTTYNSYRGELLIVSGGGTGAGIVAEDRYFNINAGYGSAGGVKGSDGINFYTPSNSGYEYYRGTGGTQTAGGVNAANSGNATANGSFGRGGTCTPPSNDVYGGPGGGGGYFGGGSSNRSHAAAGGGSSYIGNGSLTTSNGITKHMTCYRCTTDGNAATLTYSNTCHNATPTADCAKEGSGYAKITVLETETMLKSLTVDNVEIEEDFDKFRKNYTWIIPKNVDTLTDENVQATPLYSSAQVIIPEEVPYTQDGDKFKIIVIGSDETRETYTLTMQRYVSNDARLKSITASEGQFSEEFDPDDDTYLLEIFDDVDSVTLDAEAYEQDGEIIDGLGEITLEENETDHEITVQAEDGTIKVYSIRIRKNMYLKNIAVEGLGKVECEKEQCELEPEFTPEKSTYKMKVPQDYDKLDVTYVPSSEDLTVGIRVNGDNYVKNMSLQKAVNEIKFNIYDKDNAIIKTYTLNLIREKTNTGKLRNLVVNKGHLTEEFHKNKEDYIWVIPKGTDVLKEEDVTVTLFDNYTHANIPQSVTYTKDGDKFIIEVTTNETLDISHESNAQEFIVPYTGTYKIETWGAQGGNYTSSIVGGYGAYSVGTASLTQGNKLYIYTGGQGTGLTGGYNGGGNGGLYGGQQGFGGGGATHIATTNRGLLTAYNSYRGELLIVSGGGTGAGIVAEQRYFNINAGYGSAGGVKGSDGINFYTPNNTGHYYYRGTGATQTAGGVNAANSGNATANGSFGRGGTCTPPSNDVYGGPGGGAGYFGGGSSNRSHAAAGGGSSYIGNGSLTTSNGITKHMTCYNCTTSSDAATRTYSNSCHSASPTADCAKEGSGYARITLLDTDAIQMTKTYTLELQREISDDARLATLTSDKGFFTEPFDKDQHDYVLELYHHDTSVTLDGTPFEQDAEVIDGLGELNLTEDETEHQITVQAEDGTIGIYNIIIRRDMYIEDLGLHGLEGLYCKSDECHMSPEFSPEVIDYDYKVPLDYETLDVYYEPASAVQRSEMTINGEPYEEGYQLPYTGTTVVQVHVYNASDEIVKTYTMNVIKEYKHTEEYDYTGEEEPYIAPRTGKYKLEIWGAQGGTYNSTIIGGYGGYSVGYINLDKKDYLHVNVGGSGKVANGNNETGGYNGGGKSIYPTDGLHHAGSGGGATHIATKTGLLSALDSYRDDILIVAGGGGGSYWHNNGIGGNGGAGGGYLGNSGTSNTSRTPGKGGSQTAGGEGNTTGTFGQGGSGHNGAGGGFFGGGGTNGGDGAYNIAGAGGGSGYIGNTELYSDNDASKHMTCYNCSTSNEEAIKTQTTTCHNQNPIEDCSKEGNGYAKITLLETETMLASLDVDSIELVEDFDKYKTEYTWIIPKGKDDFTSDDIEAVLLNPDKAHLEMPSEPVHFTKDGDKFTFKVVAENGEEDTYTLTMIRYKSDDARLKSLETDKGVMYPKFDPDTDTYSIELYNIEEKITLTGEPMDEDAVVSGLGDVKMDSSEVTKEIVVTAEDGTTKVYTVVIRDDSYLMNIGLNGLDGLPCVGDECILKPVIDPDDCEDDECDLNSTFTPSIKEYEIRVPYEYSSLKAYYIIANTDNSVTIKVNDGNYTEGQALPVGETEVKYLVYNSRNVLVNTYTMKVIRQKGNIATLDSLEVSVGELNIPFRSDLEEYTWIIPFDTTAVLDDYVTVTATDPGANVSMPASVTYSQDGDEFNITVTAEDGVTTKTYKLRLQKDIIEDIEVNDTLYVPVGARKNLYVNGLPEGCEGIFLYEIDQNAIAYVDNHGDVYGYIPGEATITVSVKNHPEIEAKTVHVIVVSDKLESDIYSLRINNPGEEIERIFIGAEPLTTIAEFKDNMLNPNEYLKIYNKDGIEIDDDDDIVKTGLVIKLEVEGLVLDQAYIIVRGDINGDGIADVTDEAIMTDHILGAELIEGIKIFAADVHEDGIIDVSDDSSLTDYILGAIDSLNE